MTNPDNVGGLVWYVCTSCLLMVQLPSDTPTLGRCQCSPKGWSLRRAKLPSGYELCRAAPAGGDPERGKIDPSWSLFDRVDFALRDAGFDLDEASDIAALAAAQESALAGAHTAKDSAPAGSGEVEVFEDFAREFGADLTPYPDKWKQGDVNPPYKFQHANDLWNAWQKAHAAALLRKLQQGADYVMVPRVPTDEMETAHRMYGDTSDWWQAVIAASQGQEGGANG